MAIVPRASSTYGRDLPSGQGIRIGTRKGCHAADHPNAPSVVRDTSRARAHTRAGASGWTSPDAILDISLEPPTFIDLGGEE
jgi:hypothetical protein